MDMSTVGRMLSAYHAGDREGVAGVDGTDNPGFGARIASAPENLVWGYFPRDANPVAVVEPGETFEVQTISHQGVIADEDPVTYFSRFGVDPELVLEDAARAYTDLERKPGTDGHVLTGPIQIDGAEPGDVLEVRILGAELRVPYGINRCAPGRGLLPDLVDTPGEKLFWLDESGDRLVLGEHLKVPVAPFPGILAVAPSGSDGVVGSRGPGAWGGNIDFSKLGAGSSLLLPVFRPGAQFFVGDPHSAQGDGEINGTAIEHSASFSFQALIHKRMPLRGPVAFDAEHLYAFGMDASADVALELTATAAVELIQGYSLGQIGASDAYTACSVAVNFGFAEVVNGNMLAYAAIPRSIFT